MKFKINGEEVEIKDADSFVIELEGDFQNISTVKKTKRNTTVKQYSVGAGSINIRGDFYPIKIIINGNVGQVETISGDIKVKGDSKNIDTMSGNVTVNKNVNGDIDTMSGDIRVKGSVKGSIDTMSGDVKIN